MTGVDGEQDNVCWLLGVSMVVNSAAPGHIWQRSRSCVWIVACSSAWPIIFPDIVALVVRKFGIPEAVPLLARLKLEVDPQVHHAFFVLKGFVIDDPHCP